MNECHCCCVVDTSSCMCVRLYAVGWLLYTEGRRLRAYQVIGLNWLLNRWHARQVLHSLGSDCPIPCVCMAVSSLFAAAYTPQFVCCCVSFVCKFALGSPTVLVFVFQVLLMLLLVVADVLVAAGCC